jgi:arginyl-tRNA synthetase
VITGDLDRELGSALRTAGDLPCTAGTWRPDSGGDPASFATAIVFELARSAGRAARDLAEDLAGALREVPWICAVRVAADGHLTVEVTPQALAASAAAMAAAGPACAASSILAGTRAIELPWPDLAVQPGWPDAWHAQANAMAGRLAGAAGASVTASAGGRGTDEAGAVTRLPSPVRLAVAYFGADAVRYWVARMTAAGGPWPRSGAQAGPADPFYAVRQARAEAASTLRWAAELGVGGLEAGEQLGGLLTAPAERVLLGMLSFLPVRVAAAARRGRPHELPRYLEQVGMAWLECRRCRPALPFGGRAAPRDPAEASARLVLAGAAGAVLAAGLRLTGVGTAAGGDAGVGVSGAGT